MVCSGQDVVVGTGSPSFVFPWAGYIRLFLRLYSLQIYLDVSIQKIKVIKIQHSSPHLCEMGSETASALIGYPV